VLDRLLPAAARVFVEGVTAFEVQTVRLGVHAHSAIERLDENIDAPRDVVGQHALKIENLAGVALVRVSPQVHVGGHLDQLRRDSHAPAAVSHSAFHDGVHVQLAPDLLDALLRSTVARYGGARGHADCAGLDQIGNQRVGQPIGKVLLFGISREILERHHRERRNARGGRPVRHPPPRFADAGSRFSNHDALVRLMDEIFAQVYPGVVQ